MFSSQLKVSTSGERRNRSGFLTSVSLKGDSNVPVVFPTSSVSHGLKFGSESYEYFDPQRNLCSKLKT